MGVVTATAIVPVPGVRHAVVPPARDHPGSDKFQIWAQGDARDAQIEASGQDYECPGIVVRRISAGGPGNVVEGMLVEAMRTGEAMEMIQAQGFSMGLDQCASSSDR